MAIGIYDSCNAVNFLFVVAECAKCRVCSGSRDGVFRRGESSFVDVTFLLYDKAEI